MVFLNTPFNVEYQPMFEVIVFTVMSCGFTPRSVLESWGKRDASVTRLDRLFRLMRESEFSIHDLASGARGNVLLEAGMFLAVARLAPVKGKLLILDKEPHAYREYLSDLAGLDIWFHKGDQQALAAHVRNWLAAEVGTAVPSAAEIWKDYKSFRSVVPALARKSDPGRIEFPDLVDLIDAWLARHA